VTGSNSAVIQDCRVAESGPRRFEKWLSEMFGYDAKTLLDQGAFEEVAPSRRLLITLSKPKPKGRNGRSSIPP